MSTHSRGSNEGLLARGGGEADVGVSVSVVVGEAVGVSVRVWVRVKVGVMVGAEVAAVVGAVVTADVGVFLCVSSCSSDGELSTWLLSGTKTARTASSVAKKDRRATTSTKATGRAVVLTSTLLSLSESLP